MDTEEKVRENRLRRMATRQGFRLEKSRRRDPMALDYGLYYIIDGPAGQRGGANWRSRELVTSEYGFTLDEVERWLSS
jgi:hypothetical protein